MSNIRNDLEQFSANTSSKDSVQSYFREKWTRFFIFGRPIKHQHNSFYCRKICLQFLNINSVWGSEKVRAALLLPFKTVSLKASGTTPPLPLPRIRTLRSSPNLVKSLQSHDRRSWGTFVKSITFLNGVISNSVKYVMANISKLNFHLLAIYHL